MTLKIQSLSSILFTSYVPVVVGVQGLFFLLYYKNFLI